MLVLLAFDVATTDFYLVLFAFLSLLLVVLRSAPTPIIYAALAFSGDLSSLEIGTESGFTNPLFYVGNILPNYNK